MVLEAGSEADRSASPGYNACMQSRPRQQRRCRAMDMLEGRNQAEAGRR